MHHVTLIEDIRYADSRTRRKRCELLPFERAKLFHIALRLNTGLCKVPFFRLRQLTLSDILKAQLNGIIAISSLCLYLCDIAWTGLDHRHRDVLTLSIEDASHANFFT